MTIFLGGGTEEFYYVKCMQKKIQIFQLVPSVPISHVRI